MADEPPSPGPTIHRTTDGSNLNLGLDPGARAVQATILPPGGTGFRRKLLRRVQKLTAQHYYQLLTGHAAIGSFLHDRMTGSQTRETDECWWSNCGKRQPHHHLFTNCKAWTPQIRELWKRIGKDCRWEHPRAPALRWLWKKDATGAVLEFLGRTQVGCRTSAEADRTRVDELSTRSTPTTIPNHNRLLWSSGNGTEAASRTITR